MADSRYSKLFTNGALSQDKAIKRIKSLEPEITPEEEVTEASNLRNSLADFANPMLPQGFQIPKQTQADEIRNLASIPEQIGQSAGSIREIPSQRFGNILQKVGPQAEQNLGKVTVIPEATQALGKVELKPSMADLAADASKVGMKKQLNSVQVMQELESRYGQELAKRKEAMKQGLLTPDAYNSFKQEMINKIRRGE